MLKRIEVETPLARACRELEALAARGPWSVIYADPPWKYENWSKRGEERNPVSLYKCLTAPELRELPVAGLAARDAFLFMWVTTPILVKARWRGVVRAWGFEPASSAFVWVKTRARLQDEMFVNRFDSWHTGLGYTTRKNVEMCILARRGQPERLSKAVRELIVEPLREHSHKPEEARRRIMQFARGPYLELFAREAAEGWTAWGDEIGAAPVFKPRRPRLRLTKR